MVYKSGQSFLPFCHNLRVWQTDGRTDGRTDGQTDRILIARPRLHYMQRGNKFVDYLFALFNVDKIFSSYGDDIVSTSCNLRDVVGDMFFG